MGRYETLTVVRGMIYEAERELVKRMRMASQYMLSQGYTPDEAGDILDKAINDVADTLLQQEK